MTAPSATLGRKLPPRRGVPYFDVAAGETRILPRQGGRAVPYLREVPKESFDARRALRRAGVRTAGAADSGARRTSDALGSVAGDFAPSRSTGLGGLLFYIFLSVIGLALLHNALGGPGPAAIGKILGFVSGGIDRLVSPTDPLVSRGVLPSSAPATSSVSVQPQTGSAIKVPAGNVVTRVLAAATRVIGLPYQGTHAKAFNVSGGSDNWQSENAVDLSVPVGTQVTTPAAGVVTGVGTGGAGRFAGASVTVQAAGNSFWFGHLSAVGVKPGDKVAAGQVLGKSGSANGVAHLHFAAQTGNPLSWLFAQ